MAPLGTYLWNDPRTCVVYVLNITGGVSRSTMTEYSDVTTLPHSSHVVSSLPDKTPVHPPPADASTYTNTPAAADVAVTIFPLSDLFDPRVACHVCFMDGKSIVTAEHSCRQDVLVVQSKQTRAWFRVRERINHVHFVGKYHICNQRPDYAIGKRCPRGDSCTFAHSEVERALWMAEKLGQFNIREFIQHAGTRSEVTARLTVESVLSKHAGQLAFLCRDCYLYSRRVSMQSPANPTLCSVEAHDWSTSAVLAHCSLAAGNITLISRCPVSLTATDYTLCLMGAFCRRRWTGECSHAHSVVERDLWCVQRDCALTQLQMTQQVCVLETRGGVGKSVVLEHKSGNTSETRKDRGKVTTEGL